MPRLLELADVQSELEERGNVLVTATAFFPDGERDPSGWAVKFVVRHHWADERGYVDCTKEAYDWAHARIASPPAPEHYGNGPFPMDFQVEECRFIRVFGRIGDFLVGAFWWGESMDDAVTVQALTWSLDGVYSKGEFPHMDLPPSPRVMADRKRAITEKIAHLEAEQARINQRLAEHPDAPEEWKLRDRERLAFNETDLRELRGRLEKLT